MIGALAKLKSQGSTDFEYHLAGGGDNTALKNLAERLGVADQVVFEGSLPHDKMFDWLDSMDVYIQPSTVEAMPRALIEAMSRGLPAFASKVGGMPELLGGNAIFEKRDVDGIAKLLSSINYERMEKMAYANYEHAKQFQREILEEKRHAFYADFAAAAKGERV